MCPLSCDHYSGRHPGHSPAAAGKLANHCGFLQEPMVGAYAFSSKKAARVHADRGRCVAHMFIMHVAEELPTWPESTERQRVWVGLNCVSRFM